MATLNISGDARQKYGDNRDETTDLEASAIQNFFTGASVFITGGTGFMGQVLLEKLLRSCPGIERVYLLIRPKRGKEIQERLEELFQGELFSVLRREQPQCHLKVTLVPGDVALEDLGLSKEDREVLVKEVHVIFHVAATVRFNEKLRIANNINIRGTKAILAMAKEMINLKALVHVSTAFCNCTRKEIDEKFYKPGFDDEKLEELCNCVDDEQLDAITPTLLGAWPNTYSFTKAIAEDCIRKYGQQLPIAIVRPSMVINTAYEPIKGWINNLYGPVGLTAGAAAGLIKTIHCDIDLVADMVPVDMTINCCISAAWAIGERKSNHEKIITNEAIPIYNYVSSNEMPMTWSQYMKYAAQLLDTPFLQAIWYASLTLNKNRTIHNFYKFFLHYLPAILVDTAAQLIGKKPRLLKAYEQLDKFTATGSYFCTRQWRYSTDHVLRLWRTLGPRDQQLFHFNMATVDWKTVIHQSMIGVRVYVMKEPLDNVEEARRHFRKLKYLHYTVVIVLNLLMLSLLCWIIRMLV